MITLYYDASLKFARNSPEIQIALIAQSVEQRIENPRVPGSIPGQGTIFLFIETKKPTSDCGLFSFYVK